MQGEKDCSAASNLVGEMMIIGAPANDFFKEGLQATKGAGERRLLSVKKPGRRYGDIWSPS